MTLHDRLVDALLAPAPTEKPSDWCCKNIRFNEPEIKGWFTLRGREYLRELIDDVNREGVDDFVYVMGTGTGKTIAAMAKAGWEIEHLQRRCLWVLPATDGPGGARSFNRTRFLPMLRASPSLAKYIPKGADRHDVSSASVSIHGAHYDFVGSNSPAQIAANRCGSVRQDEVDKFFKGSDAEASASYNADRRTDNVEGAKREKYSSPTLENALTWSTFWNKTDRRRHFVPCPHCSKYVVLAWSKKFSVFAITGDEAFVTWDKAAKKDDGWDLDLVDSSAHFVCPHCDGKIFDEHKPGMNLNGEWRATTKGAPRWIGRHLPAMYSTASSCRTGALAREFLLAISSPEGPKGFINSRLAEPDVSQAFSIDRQGIVAAKVEVGSEWINVMGVDCQQKAPYFWWLIRAWTKGKAHGIACGSAMSWEELDAIQAQHRVANECVVVDSGFGARSDAEVYQNCARRCRLEAGPQDSTPWCIGWMPAKAGGGKYYKDTESGLYVPVRLGVVDPYQGSDKAGGCRMELLEFQSEFFEDVFENLRRGKTYVDYTISAEVDNEEYHRHANGKVKRRKESRGSGYTYKYETLRPDWPDHLRACEINISAFVWHMELLTSSLIKYDGKINDEKELTQ